MVEESSIRQLINTPNKKIFYKDLNIAQDGETFWYEIQSGLQDRTLKQVFEKEDRTIADKPTGKIYVHFEDTKFLLAKVEFVEEEVNLCGTPPWYDSGFKVGCSDYKAKVWKLKGESPNNWRKALDEYTTDKEALDSPSDVFRVNEQKIMLEFETNSDSTDEDKDTDKPVSGEEPPKGLFAKNKAKALLGVGALVIIAWSLTQ